MGLQVDLCAMFGLPKKHECPKCKKIIDTHLDDFDLECEEPSRGLWDMGFYCPECEHEWKVRWVVSFTREIDFQPR